MRTMKKLLIGLGVCAVMLVLASVFSPVDLIGAVTELTTYNGLRVRPSGDIAEAVTDLRVEIEDTSDVDAVTIDGAGDTKFLETGGSTGDADLEVDGYAQFDGTVELNAALDLDSTFTLDTATANPIIITSTLAGASVAQQTYNNNDDVTGQQWLLSLDYDDDGDADADFLRCRDNQSADTKFSISQEGDTVGNGNWTLGDAVATDTITLTATFLSNMVFEGATADASETTLSITDPTADRTVTVPNGTGTLALGEAAYRIYVDDTNALVAGALTWTFPTAFSAIPSIFATANQTTGAYIYTTSLSTTAVTFASSEAGGATTAFTAGAIGPL